jgi:S-adenosylmethionine hydrolase
MSAAAAPVVTLTTDFGVRDPFVGLMKVQIHARCPAAHVVDFTHDLPAFQPAAAAFWLERARRWCPPGTVHVVVVDPGVGTARRLLAAEAGGQRFVGPDNGVLGEVLATGAVRVHAIDAERLARFGLGAPSATFHGRDVLAPVAAELAAGRVSLAELGDEVADWVPSAIPKPRRGDDGLHGEVLLLDRYGNAFTNLPGEAATVGATVEVVGRRLPVVRTYGDATPGDAVALANSFGVVEIAVARGDAGAAFGLSPGVPVRLATP